MQFGAADGSFGTATDYQTGFGAIDVILRDVDQDGDLDIVTANRTGDSVSVLKNRGGGIFAQPVRTLDGFAATQAVGDFNGNGLEDLVVAKNDGSWAILLSQGAGGFQAPVEIPAGRMPADIAVGDFDADGDLDMAAQTSSYYFGSPSVLVLLGMGDGTFAAPVEISLTASLFGSFPAIRSRRNWPER